MGAFAADLAAHLYPVAVGDAYVEHGNVGVAGTDAGQSFGSRRCLADDLHLAGHFEQGTNPLTNDFMIIEEENANPL